MSCNPSFGGVGKGILVREIDALDGVCGKVCDASGIHFKMLNATKGAAVHGPRAQIDRKLYKKNIQNILFSYPNLSIKAASVCNLLFEGDLTTDSCKVKGVSTDSGEEIRSQKIIIATGTFLSGTIRIGKKSFPAGRMGEKPTTGVSESLQKAGFNISRMRTGKLMPTCVHFA